MYAVFHVYCREKCGSPNIRSNCYSAPPPPNKLLATPMLGLRLLNIPGASAVFKTKSYCLQNEIAQILNE